MSTVEDVQQAMMQQIMRGELEPGTWLRQDELAARLGVSKIPVREALHRLAAHGLLHFERNRGVVTPTLSVTDAEEIYDLRLAIEPALLKRAMPNLSIVDFAAAELAVTDSVESVTASNWSFHSALYTPSGWHRGMGIAATLHAAVAPYVALYVEGLDGAAESDQQHRAILEHCRERDVRGAVSVLVDHLRESETGVDGGAPVVSAVTPCRCAG